MNIPSLFCAVSLIFVPASFGADSFSATLKKLPAESGKSSFVSNWIPLELKEADMQEKYIDSTRVTDVGKAQMQFYFPAGWRSRDKRPALCIFPGGGYALMAIDKEGVHIARWAAEHGMVGVVVKYRVSQKNNAIGKFPGPLLDARQALRLTRKHAGELGVDPGKIGVMGFSAGGHLAAMAATLWTKSLPEEADQSPQIRLGPSGFCHADLSRYYDGPKRYSSRHAQQNHRLKADPSLEELCSAERQVTPNTPPVFLVHAQDDGVASANSKLMEKACRDKGVPVTLRLYSRGGHGYGMEKRGNPTDQWPEDAEKWLFEREILPVAAQRRGTENAAAADSSGKREE